MNGMKSAATIRQPAPPARPDDWGNEPCLPSDLHAMREGDRADAEGRLISDAAVGRKLRQLVRKLQCERAGGSR